MAFKRTVTLRVSCRFPAIRFDAPTLLSFSGFTHAKWYLFFQHSRLPTLVLFFALFSNVCFACFASQTSGFCSAFPSAPVKYVTRFCYALVSVFCLTNTRFVQCYPLSSRKVCCTLLFNLFDSVILVLRALPHKHRLCAVLFPRLQ